MRYEEVTAGQRVRVTGRWNEYDDGWNNSWNPDMDAAIGHEFTVLSFGSHGVRFVNDDELSINTGYFSFPWQVLELVYEASVPLTDGNLCGPDSGQLRQMRYRQVGSIFSFSNKHNDPATESAHIYLAAIAGVKEVEAEARFGRWKTRRAHAKNIIRRIAMVHEPRPSWRFITCIDKAAAIAQAKVLGAEVREIMRSVAEDDRAALLDHERICDILNGLSACSSESAQRVFDAINGRTRFNDLGVYVHKCDDCGTWVESEYTNHVDGGDEVCGGCIQNYRWSECMDTHIHIDRACALYTSRGAYHNEEPNDWVTRDYGRREYYESPHSSYIYFDSEAFDDLFPDDVDELGDNECDGLSGYHSARRDFTERWDPKSPYPALGVELEVDASGHYSRRSDADAIRELEDGHICEQDGSLNDDTGFEVVTRPFGKAEWGTAEVGVAQRLLDECRHRGVVGYNTSGLYGIHITVHRRHLSPLQEARIFMFLVAEENGDFVRAVAQRRASYGEPAVDIGKVSRQKVKAIGGLCERSKRHPATGRHMKYQKKIYGTGKYSPINWKEELAEFRLFQSTTFFPSFMKNLEFVWALIEWTSTASATGSSWHHEGFVKWLGHRPQARKDYPHLVEYLSREKYKIKGGYKITNTWLPALKAGMKRCVDGAEQDEGASEKKHVSVELPKTPPTPPVAATPVVPKPPVVETATEVRTWLEREVIDRQALRERLNEEYGRAGSASHMVTVDAEVGRIDGVRFNLSTVSSFPPISFETWDESTPQATVEVSEWINWSGGAAAPCAVEDLTHIRMRDGSEYTNNGPRDFVGLRWGDSNRPGDIVAYRMRRPITDGWITWGGGGCPVHGNTRVEYRMRGQRTDRRHTDYARNLRWNHTNSLGDIVAYRRVNAARRAA